MAKKEKSLDEKYQELINVLNPISEKASHGADGIRRIYHQSSEGVLKTMLNMGIDKEIIAKLDSTFKIIFQNPTMTKSVITKNKPE